MSSAVCLVQFSAIDIEKLLPIGRQCLDRNLAEAADSAGHEPPLHHMLCVAAIKDPAAKTAEHVRPYMNLFHAGFIVIADERDWTELLELAGMPCVLKETVERGFFTGLISGTLAQWQAAILRGCQREVSREVRNTYNMIYTQFTNLGLASSFSFKSKPHKTDQTFLLEFKP